MLSSLQAFLPLLGADTTLEGPPGRIINMSSISGKYSAPFVGAYCASKHALEGMSDSLRRELMLFGIDVVVIGASTSNCLSPSLFDYADVTDKVPGWVFTALSECIYRHHVSCRQIRSQFLVSKVLPPEEGLRCKCRTCR